MLAAEGYGKHKTVSQIVAIIAIFMLQSYDQWGAAGEAIFSPEIFGRIWIWRFAELAKWLAVILTFVSGSLYLWKNRALYLDDM